MQILYTFSGTVQHGKGRGKDFGFPTANIPLTQKIPEGIYCSRISVDGTWHNALTFIGNPKTFAESDYKAETYILDFTEELYGKLVHVELQKHLRENERFDSPALLIAQMRKDEEQARIYFASIT